MVYNQIFGVKLEYGIHNTPRKADVLSESSYLSGTSFMSSSSSSLSNAGGGGEPYSFKAPDGGWGWVN